MKKIYPLLIFILVLAFGNSARAQIDYSYGSLGATFGFDDLQGVSLGAYVQFGHVGFSGYWSAGVNEVSNFCDGSSCEANYALYARGGYMDFYWGLTDNFGLVTSMGIYWCDYYTFESDFYGGNITEEDKIFTGYGGGLYARFSENAIGFIGYKKPFGIALSFGYSFDIKKREREKRPEKTKPPKLPPIPK